MRWDFDLTVIGGGPAGLSACTISALFGAKTALIEASRLGGECTWSGCVPSKTLLKAAKVAHQLRVANKYGLDSSPPTFDFKALIQHIKEVQEHIYEEADAPPNLERFGIEVIPGYAKFLDAHTVEVTNGDSRVSISSKYFVVATGSKPRVPDIEGIHEVPYLTNQNIFKLSTFPKNLVVIGSGPAGMEMAQAFRRLGANVVVITSSDRVLPHDDPELTAILGHVLIQEGCKFMFKTAPTKVAADTNGITVVTNSGERVRADAILISTGRQTNLTDLNLASAGVRWNETGVLVNKHCQTSAKNIYAAGDVTAQYFFTHMAEHMGKIAVFNALLHLPYSIDVAGVTWCTFTDPELAHVGISQAALIERRIRHRVYRFPFSKIDRAITDAEAGGLVKVFAHPFTGRIYGATIVGPNAGEMIGEYNVAIRGGISLRKISETIHPYPTYALGNRRAADQWYIQKQTSRVIRTIQWLFSYRGTFPGIDEPDRIV